MVSLPVVCILVIIQINLVLPMKILEKKNDGLFYRRFKRQNGCPNGEYPGDKHCCKYCKKGTYLEFDCKDQHGEPMCKICTEGVDFMDEESGSQKCHICQPCESGSGHEVLRDCTVSQNTVCKCKDGFFCSDSLLSPNGNCNRCRHCTRCDNGIAEPCTPTKDTVCHPESSRVHTIVWPVLSVFIIAGIVFGVFFYCRRHKERGNISVVAEPLIDHKPTCPPDLESIDLENHLYDISDIMLLDSVKKLASRKLTLAQLEVIERNHPGNAREEKSELLKTWYTANGRRRAFRILCENTTNGEIEKILDLVRKQNAEP